MILKDHVTTDWSNGFYYNNDTIFYCIFDPKRQPWWA